MSSRVGNILSALHKVSLSHGIISLGAGNPTSVAKRAGVLSDNCSSGKHLLLSARWRSQRIATLLDRLRGSRKLSLIHETRTTCYTAGVGYTDLEKASLEDGRRVGENFSGYQVCCLCRSFDKTANC